ncbi:MAG: NfeD family protein [Cyanobacteria bacterium P01_A01_bin.135]
MTNAMLLNADKAPSQLTTRSLWRQVVGLLGSEGDTHKRWMPVVDSKLFGQAVVDTAKANGKQWRVRYAATYWTAEAAEPGLEFFPEDRVQVVGRYGTVLLIERL